MECKILKTDNVSYKYTAYVIFGAKLTEIIYKILLHDLRNISRSSANLARIYESYNWYLFVGNHI